MRPVANRMSFSATAHSTSFAPHANGYIEPRSKSLTAEDMTVGKTVYEPRAIRLDDREEDDEDFTCCICGGLKTHPVS